MLFALSVAGVPSHTHVLQVGPIQVGIAKAATMEAAPPEPTIADRFTPPPGSAAVSVGLVSRCPYGLANCWSGAYHNLMALEGVLAVRPYAEKETSTATVYVAPGTIPDTEAWTAAFKGTANGSYDVWGFEMTFEGLPGIIAGELVLDLGQGDVVTLTDLATVRKIQWDWTASAAAEPRMDELSAFARLNAKASQSGVWSARVTGPFSSQGGKRVLAVRVVVDVTR